MREEAVMSDPLEVVALLRELVRKEIALGILDAELIKLGCIGLDGQPTALALNHEISRLSKDVSDLSTRFVHAAEKL
jgi:hypothetical protein